MKAEITSEGRLELIACGSVEIYALQQLFQGAKFIYMRSFYTFPQEPNPKFAIMTLQSKEIKRGGPLSCRECGRPVNREEPEVHFIEDGKCDCKACYDKAMNDVRIFEIWQEGYCVTGDRGPAAHLGNASGKDFRSACVDFFKEKGNKDFDVDELSVWGCSLFDNEKDARKLFG